MRFASLFIAVTATVLALPTLAHADEPSGGALRLEVGGGAETQLGPEPQVLSSARVGLGVRLSRRLELTASLRHAFFPDQANPYKEAIAYDDLAVGLRFTQPLGDVRLYLEPGLVMAWWDEGNGAEVYDNRTPGVALRVGLELPLTEQLSLGGGLGSSAALGTEDFFLVFASAELHLGWRF